MRMESVIHNKAERRPIYLQGNTDNLFFRVAHKNYNSTVFQYRLVLGAVLWAWFVVLKDADAMATVVAQSHYIFGLRTGVRNNLLYFDEQTVIFPCGNNCVRYNINQKWQKFIPEKATITVYDLQHEQSRKRKVLTGGDISVDEFVCMAFSPDSKYLIGQAGGPDWTLFLWMWEKKKVMATVKTSTDGPIHQVSFNPEDNTQICVSGNGVFKIFRYAGETLKQSNIFKTDTHNFLCHTWMSTEQVIAGTDAGQLMIQSEKQDSKETSSTLPRVTAIVGYSNGFACSAGPGTVCLFEKIEEEDQYKKTKEIKIPPELFSNDPSSAEQQEISTLCISPSEETLAASTDRGQLYDINLSLAEYNKGACVQFKRLSHSSHSSVITGLSTCIRKPLIATCSMDRSMYKEFQEEAYSVALHPTGLYILVGFSDKLRLMTLLIDDIRIFKEFNVRGCREVRLTIAQVRAIAFSADDSRLVSCGMDGAVYEWNTLTGKRESESVLKTCSYTGVTISSDSKTFFAVGTDCSLKEIQDCQILKEVRTGDVVCTTVAMSRSGRALFVGTSTGTVRAIKYPLPIQNDWIEYQAHAGPVTKMVITFDDQFLITVSEDSSLFIWKIIDKEGQGLKREKELRYAEEILITKSDLEEKNKLMLDLNARVMELQKENKYQLSLRDIEYKEKINELTEKCTQQINSLNAEKEVLKAEKEKQQAVHVKALSEVLEKHDKEQQDMESTNNQKLMLEYEKYQELQLKLHKVQQEYEQQLHSNQEESQQKVREFEEYIKQEEEDADMEIHEIRMKYEQNLKEEKKANTRLKVELDTTTKQKLQSVIKALENDITGLKIAIQKRDGIIQDKFRAEYMEEQIEPKEKEIQELKEQMLEMEGELKEFHKTNTQLELKTAELTLKLKTKDKEMHKEMRKVQDIGVLVQRFKADLHTCVECIQDPKRLKENIRELYKCYVQPSDVVEKVVVDTDIQRENHRQREHYEKIITTLKNQLTRDTNVFQANNTKLMKDNVILMKEINDLRQELRTVRMQLHNYESQSSFNKNIKSSANTRGAASAGRNGLMSQQSLEEAEKIIQFQRLEIQRLKQEMNGHTPSSRTKLPPLTN
ncbi:Cilia- and flagella-associated protein 57 [Labeo rohita]|uniref:Cilia- and flagella-associated protein 57 n=1 Tax=Labeo rohita TaxID=84645 RepID=A0ABQ8MXD9_LABRO|nr:Cilia- and flagella-associated protein 57 [Labeo rohita]